MESLKCLKMQLKLLLKYGNLIPLKKWYFKSTANEAPHH